MIAHTKTGPDPGHADSHKAVLQAGDDTITITGFRSQCDAARIGWAITGVLQHFCAGDRVSMTIHPEETA